MTAAVKLLPRGVHHADYLIDGCPVLLAIDSRGNCVKRGKLLPDTDEECARAWLEGLLDHYDPLPRRPALTLHRTPRIPRGAFLAMIRHARRS
jgi:hypothetical protein